MGTNGPLARCWWEYKMITFALECNLAVSYEVNQTYCMAWQFDSQVFTQEKWKFTKRLQPQHTSVCMQIFTAALFIVAHNWTKPNWPSTCEWINKMQYLHTMERYSQEQEIKHCYVNMNESPKYHTEQRRQTKGYILWDSVCTQCRKEESNLYC